MSQQTLAPLVTGWKRPITDPIRVSLEKEMGASLPVFPSRTITRRSTENSSRPNNHGRAALAARDYLTLCPLPTAGWPSPCLLSTADGPSPPAPLPTADGPHPRPLSRPRERREHHFPFPVSCFPLPFALCPINTSQIPYTPPNPRPGLRSGRPRSGAGPFHTRQ